MGLTVECQTINTMFLYYLDSNPYSIFFRSEVLQVVTPSSTKQEANQSPPLTVFDHTENMTP
jgi:hypothetical protein